MKLTKKLAAIAACACMAATSMVGMGASAAFSTSLLKDCGSNAIAGYSYANSAQVETSGDYAYGRVKLYEKSGNYFDKKSACCYAELYDADTHRVVSAKTTIHFQSEYDRNMSVEASCPISKASRYYCKGYTVIDSNNDGEMDYKVFTNQTSTIS